jgi:hypothetical protein
MNSSDLLLTTKKQSTERPKNSTTYCSSEGGSLQVSNHYHLRLQLMTANWEELQGYGEKLS